MLEQDCITCGAKFDYFNNSATVICSQNHVVCKQCARQLIRTNSKCPHCFGPVVVANQPIQVYSNNNNYINPQQQANKNINQLWQPVPNTSTNLNQPQINYSNNPILYQNQPNIYQNQGFQPQPYQPIPIKHPTNNPGKYCFFSVIFLIIAIVLLVIRIKMENCSYWDVLDCGYQYGTKYCCIGYCQSSATYSNCDYIYYY